MPLINQPQINIGDIAANPYLGFDTGIVTVRFVIENDIPILWQGFSSYGSFQNYGVTEQDIGAGKFGPNCYPVSGDGNSFLAGTAITTTAGYTPNEGYRPDDPDPQLNVNVAGFHSDWFTFLGAHTDKVVAGEYVLTKQSCQFYGTNCNLLIGYGDGDRYSRSFTLLDGGYYETTTPFELASRSTLNGLALAVEFTDGGSAASYKVDASIAFDIQKIV